MLTNAISLQARQRGVGLRTQNAVAIQLTSSVHSVQLNESVIRARCHANRTDARQDRSVNARDANPPTASSFQRWYQIWTASR